VKDRPQLNQMIEDMLAKARPAGNAVQKKSPAARARKSASQGGK